VIDTDFFSLFGFILLVYMLLGCVLSLLIVFKEILITVNLTNEQDILEYLVAINPDLRENTAKKVKIWIKKQKKMSRVLIYPNFFQIISRHVYDIAILNFIVLFITLIMRVIIAKQISDISYTSSDYVNVLTPISTLNIMKIVDGINIILIFFSLFYYSSLTSPTLRKISAFFIEISHQIINLSFLFIFMLFVFAVLFHSFYEKSSPLFNDFSNSFISTMNLSMGNQFLNENDDLISELGTTYYYLFLIIEYIWMYLIMLVLIYVITGRQFLNQEIRDPIDK
jgi:Polycystin cation channel